MLFIPDRDGFATRFRQTLENQRLTAEAAGERLRLTPDLLDDALRGDPTLSVLIAIVREFAIDPTWLLMGEYNGGTHRAALEDPVRVVHETLKRLESRSRPRERDGDSHAPA